MMPPSPCKAVGKAMDEMVDRRVPQTKTGPSLRIPYDRSASVTSIVGPFRLEWNHDHKNPIL